MGFGIGGGILRKKVFFLNFWKFWGIVILKNLKLWLVSNEEFDFF